MTNLATDLEVFVKARGETLALVSIGAHYSRESEAVFEPINTPLPWSVARPYLDEEYDDGFGGAHCRPFIAWTDNSVYFVCEYDGATSIRRVPRHPVVTEVEFY